MGVATEDDDGNAAADSAQQIGKNKPAATPKPVQTPPMTDEQRQDALGKLDDLLAGLEWNADYVAKYLKKNFGKDSWFSLTDDELRTAWKRLDANRVEVERARERNANV